jgi:hypothetical protein
MLKFARPSASNSRLTRDQTRKLAALQADVSKTLKQILSRDQLRQIEEMEGMFGRGGPPRGIGPGGGFGPPAFGPPRGFGGPGGPGGRGPGGTSGPGGIFRSYRFGADFPGLRGKDLKPGEKLVDVIATASPERPRRERPPLEGAPLPDRNRN